MNINEFKAWLDGYTEAKGGKLDASDLMILKGKLDEVVAPYEVYPNPYVPSPTITPFIYPVPGTPSWPVWYSIVWNNSENSEITFS